MLKNCKPRVWSEHVLSFSVKKTPREIKNTVSKEEFELFKTLPFFRADESKRIIVNEDFDGWDAEKDVLVSLDFLPDSLLLDIYNMDRRKFGAIDNTNIVGKNDDETKRRLFLYFIPEILWSHGVEVKK